MPRVSYEASVIGSIIREAAAIRKEGKQWKEAFALARKSGYKGSESSLQKLVRAHALAAKSGIKPNFRKAPRSGYKNSAKAASTNAFSRPEHTNSAVGPNVSADSSGKTRAAETLQSIQNRLSVLREGVHYARPISLFEGSFQSSRDGEIVAWSRILEREEAVCVVNSHVEYTRGADILVDSTLNPPGSCLTVIHSADNPATHGESAYPIGARIPVQRRSDGTAFVSIRNVAPAVTLVLSNTPETALSAVRTLN